MTATENRRGARFFLTLGLAAIFGGLWLFLASLGVAVPPFNRMWPVLLLLLALGSAVDFIFLSRRPGSAGWAVAWLGFAILGFTLTLDYTSWHRILNWLPSFPLVFGIALLVTWLVDHRRNEHYVIAGSSLVGLALAGFMARFEAMRRIFPSAQVLWAGLLLVVGGYLVWRSIRRMKGS